MNQLFSKLFPFDALFQIGPDSLSAYIIVLILLVFLFFIIRSLGKIHFINAQLNKSLIKNEENDLSSSKILSPLWNRYKASFIMTATGEKTFSHAKHYFSLTQILSKGMNMGALGAASNILVGLGVFGTFLGLTLGISGMDMETPDTIKDSIDGLLAGIGTAFSTSVWGMGTSLVITILEKRYQTQIKRNLYSLCSRLDEKYLFSSKDEYLMRLNQQEKTHTLFESCFIYTDEAGHKIPVSQLMKNSYQKLDEVAAAMSSFSTDLSGKIEAGFEAILQSESLQEILPTLQELKTEIKGLGNDIKSPAESMMTSVVEEIRKMTSSLISDMQESISGSTKDQLGDIAGLLASSSASLIELPDTLKKMTQDLNGAFDGFKQTQDSSFQTQAATVKSVDSVLRELQEVVGNLTAVNTHIAASLKEVSVVQDQISATTRELTGFSEIIRHSSDNLAHSQQLHQQYAAQFLEENKKALDTARSVIDVSSENAKAHIENLQVIQNGLKGIFSQVDEGLRQYQTAVETGTRSYLSGFSESLTSATKSLAAEASRQADILEDLTEIASKIKR